MSRIILDLCGGTGSWSKPYKDAGYDVRLITLPMFDVTDPYIQEQCIALNPYGILAAPPCTMFSLARTNAKIPRSLDEGMKAVKGCLSIIWGCQSKIKNDNQRLSPVKFWALENPDALLRWFLGKPAIIFHPFHFGDNYKKRTALWGNFNEPNFNEIQMSFEAELLAKTNSRKLPKFDALETKEIHPEYYGTLDRKARRSITPAGFAKAFFEANP